MNNKSVDQDSYRSFQLMTEIENGESVSQRELAGRLGVAVGLVNSYLKNFVTKGYIRVKSFPRNRYAYLLTPKGVTEKSRLAYQHLNYFNALYKTARHDYAELFAVLSEQSVSRVAFCGADEVAEIAFLSLRETPIEMAEIFSDTRTGETFFSKVIRPFAEIPLWNDGPIVVTSARDRERLIEQVAGLEVSVSVHCPGLTATGPEQSGRL